VAGDIDRLLRSKKECLHYFFSEFKAWNPGLMAVHREVWIQVYGIPLHIWGDNFFKLIGNKLGSFVDFDAETACMARFDVARLKIIAASWGCIDEVVKLEVEGVCFNVWVVEERGKESSVVMLGGEVEDDGSVVVPLEGVDEEVEGGDVNSGEDDESGEEMEGDVRKKMVHGGEHDQSCDRLTGEQVPKGGDIVLTCEKSTNISYSQKEILSVPLRSVGNEESVCKNIEMETNVADSSKGDDSDKSNSGGSKGEGGLDNVEVDCGGPLVRSSFELVGLSDTLPDPNHVGLAVVGRVVTFQTNRGLAEGDQTKNGSVEIDVVTRYSSISEPEEVLSLDRERISKITSKSRKLKSCSKFNKLGVPKCIQFAESIKEVGPRVRRRRQKGAISHRGIDEAGSEGELPLDMDLNEVTGRGEQGGDRRQEVSTEQFNSVTPKSGIQLISDSGNSNLSDSILQNSDDREKIMQAAKLLSIQKDVGFTFVDSDKVTINQLVHQELCDRAKKMEWEQRECDQ
jgi:hypothetical protein